MRDKGIRGWLFMPALLALMMLGACESEKHAATFYPVDSLMTAQVHHLTRIGASLQKEALLSGRADTITYTPGDTAAWAKELDIFRELAVINKPVNRDNYLVTDGLLDAGSNLTIKEFRSLKKLPVVYLRVYYQGTPDKPRKIDALYEEENVMYSSSRHLSMRFTQVDMETVLTGYTIRGGQKMVLSDSIAYHISGKILLD